MSPTLEMGPTSSGAIVRILGMPGEPARLVLDPILSCEALVALVPLLIDEDEDAPEPERCPDTAVNRELEGTVDMDGTRD